MKNRYLRAILLFLGIAGIIAYSFFPNEKEMECIDKNSVKFHSYGDSASGVAFLKAESFDFKCGLMNKNGNCGIGFSFDETVNWNLTDSLIFEMQSSPDFNELIVQILTFDPDYSKQEDRNSLKPFMKEVKLSSDKKRYAIHMEHFYVPDYWFTQQNAKDTHNAKKFYATVGMDIYSGWENPTNTEIELKINNICAEKFSNIPFVILVVYLGILIAIAIHTRLHPKLVHNQT